MFITVQIEMDTNSNQLHQPFSDTNTHYFMGPLIFGAITRVFIFALAKFLVCHTDFLVVSFQTFGQDDNLTTFIVYEVWMRALIYPTLCNFFKWNLKGLVGIFLMPVFIIHFFFHILCFDDMHMTRVAGPVERYTTIRALLYGVQFFLF